MSRPNRSSNSGAIPSNSKPQPAVVSYAQLAKQVKTVNSKPEALPSSNNDRSKDNKIKYTESESKSSDDISKNKLIVSGTKFPEPQRKIENIKILFGSFDDFKSEPFPTIDNFDNKAYDFKTISFGAGLEKVKVSETLIIPAPILANKVKLLEKEVKVNGPSNGPLSKSSNSFIPGQPPAFIPASSFIPNQPYPSGPPHNNSLAPPYSKSPYGSSGNHPYPQGHYTQFSPQTSGQMQWNNKSPYTNNSMPVGSPNSQSSYNTIPRGREKSSIQNSPGGFQQNNSPGNAGPNGPGPNWTPPYYPNFQAPHFDPNYQHYNGYVPQFPVIPPHPGMVPNNQSNAPILNSNALPFVPKVSKAIKIINPKTKSEIKAPASNVKESNVTLPTPTTQPSSAVRISKPVSKDLPSPEATSTKVDQTSIIIEKKDKLEEPVKTEGSKQIEIKAVPEAKSSIEIKTLNKTENENKGEIVSKEVKKVSGLVESSTNQNAKILDSKSDDNKTESKVQSKESKEVHIKNDNKPLSVAEDKEKTSELNNVASKVAEKNNDGAEKKESKSEVKSVDSLETKKHEAEVLVKEVKTSFTDATAKVDLTESKKDDKPKEPISAESKGQTKVSEEDLKVDEPTIISVNTTETVILPKAKSRRAVRAEVKPVVTEEAKQETTSIPQTTTAASTSDKEVITKTPSKTVTESSALPNTGNAPPGFVSKPPGFNSVTKNDLDSNKSVKSGFSVDTKNRPSLQRLGSLNLGSTGPYSPGMPSPSPRTTEFFEQVNYPPNINRPNLPDGMFRYDRSFLLQFKEMCIDKPQEMKNLDAITGDDHVRQESNDRRMNRRSNTSSRFGMKGDQNDFSKPRNSEERFKASTMQLRSDHSGRGSMGRSSSGGLLPGLASQMGHKDSKNRSGRGGRGGKHGSNQGGPTIPLDQVVPLEKSENRWVPKKASDDDKEAVVTRKTKALLNKLTLEKFESISNQLIELSNESASETDGFTLKTVIQLIFEKACDEPNFSAMYAKLCHKMQTQLSEEIYDEEVRSKNNDYTRGGHLFRKYILTRCQKEFEKGWKVEGLKELQDSDMMSDEYYKLAKAKRQGLGLIRFIGEVYKLGMLTENIMHYCIKRLIDSEGDDDEIESLSKLFTTIGRQMDTPKNKEHMAKYFEQIKELSKNKKLSQRIRFMLLDLMDLRKNKWQTGKSDTPKTLQQIKEDAARESEEKNKQDKMRRQGSSGKGLPPLNQSMKPSFDKEKRGDGWNSVSGTSSTTSRNKTGDLSGFGNLSKSKTSSSSLSFGPSTVFNSLGNAKSGGREAASQSKRANITNSNIFDMLADNESKPSATRPIIKLLTKTQTSESEAEVEEPKVKTMSPDLIERKVQTLINEYLNSNDVKEAILTAKEFEEYNCYDEVINKFMFIGIEKKKNEVEKLSELITVFNKENIISSDDFFAGAKKIMPLLEDLSTDVPFAFTYMASFLAPYSISLIQLIELSEPLAEFPNPLPAGPKFFSAYIQERLKSVDEAILIKEFEENCDITKLYNPKDRTAARLDKLSSDDKIKFLMPSIQESSSWKEVHSETSA